MSEFFNPYQFVPLTEKTNSTRRKEVIQSLVGPATANGFAAEAGELLHDRYPVRRTGNGCSQTTYSGRIACKLTTKSPGVFGNRHRKVKIDENEDTTIVENLAIAGKAAIAGTQLKGMLATLAEMASGSAMRVLQNRAMSIRSLRKRDVRWLWKRNVYNSDHNIAAGGDFSLMANNADQVPMNPARENVTMAEKMFGWVMDDGLDHATPLADQLPNAYRGRIRISDAVSEEELAELQLSNQDLPAGFQQHLKHHFPLKILSTPRLPCPEFYFTGGTAKIRSELFDPTAPVRMQGWKYYVVHSDTLDNNDPVWQSANSDNMKQKSWVRPIRYGTNFTFHIDFDNLTEAELQLLCFCLQPSETFIHRLGLGKPLGLGAVSIQAGTIEYRDHGRRYSDPFGNSSEQNKGQPSAEVSRLAGAWANQVEHRSQAALIAQSGKAVQGPPVHYPTRINPNNTEENLYQWFVNNRIDGGRNAGDVKERLEPLTQRGPSPLAEN